MYDLLNELSSFAQVHIVPGNHDGGIKQLIPEQIIIHSSEGFVHETIGFVHGHRWPHKDLLNGEFLFFGHSHPVIMLSDRLGFKSFETCWIKAKLLKQQTKEVYASFNEDITLIIHPAFNELCGGTAVNKDPLVGPLKKLVDIKHAEIFLLDGTNLGQVKEIK
jgi:metallophosphoesterase superfamily enzyme